MGRILEGSVRSRRRIGTDNRATVPTGACRILQLYSSTALLSASSVAYCTSTIWRHAGRADLYALAPVSILTAALYVLQKTHTCTLTSLPACLPVLHARVHCRCMPHVYF